MIDLLDRELIKLLEQDASQPSGKLADQLSASASTVRRRMQQLLKDGVIRIVAIPEPTRVGFPLMAVVAFQITLEKGTSFIETLSSREEVKFLCATSGRFDVIAIMAFASTEELFEFLKRDVGKIEGLKTTESFICLHVAKNL